MTITICVTSDVHGRMDRLQQIKPMIAAIKPDLLIDNGDFLQGSLSSYYYEHVVRQTHPMLKIANAMYYDCAVFGNHEFNYPLQHIEEMRAACEFPWISANIGDFSKPYFIKEVDDGRRVAIVGVTTHFTPLWDEQGYTTSLTFSEALAAAHDWVTYVHQHEQPDFIILSYHGGFTADLESGSAFAVNNGENQANEMLAIPHIDALITGHQHLQIATIVNGIPVLQPGANGSCFGVITLGDTVRCEIVPVEDVTESYPADVEQWLFENIGFCEDDFTYKGLLASRIDKPKFVDFLHEVIFDATEADLSVVELMFHEEGGFSGAITNFDVIKNISRPNSLKVLEVPGSDILAALEQCAAVFAINHFGEIDFSFNVHFGEPQPYLYDYWGGLSYTISVGAPVGQRISNVLFNGEPFVVERLYRVAMNSYRATGADFAPLASKHCVWTSEELFPTTIMKYIQSHPVQWRSFGDIHVLK